MGGRSAGERDSNLVTTTLDVQDGVTSPRYDELAGLMRDDILLDILAFCDKLSLAKSMRVCKSMLRSAASILYGHLVYDGASNPFLEVDDATDSTDSEFSKASCLRLVRTLRLFDYDAHNLVHFSKGLIQPIDLPALDVVHILWDAHTRKLSMSRYLLRDVEWRTLIMDGVHPTDGYPLSRLPLGPHSDASPPALRTAIFRILTYIPEGRPKSETVRMVRSLLLSSLRLEAYVPPTTTDIVLFFDEDDRGLGHVQPPWATRDPWVLSIYDIAHFVNSPLVLYPDKKFTVLDAKGWEPAYCGVAESDASPETILTAVFETFKSRFPMELEMHQSINAMGRFGTDMSNLRFTSLEDYLCKERPDLREFLPKRPAQMGWNYFKEGYDIRMTPSSQGDTLGPIEGILGSAERRKVVHLRWD